MNEIQEIQKVIEEEKTLKERVIIFMWGMGGFTGVAVAVYLMNINDVREIDVWKLATIVVTVGSGYVVNQCTKYLRITK